MGGKGLIVRRQVFSSFFCAGTRFKFSLLKCECGCGLGLKGLCEGMKNLGNEEMRIREETTKSEEV